MLADYKLKLQIHNTLKEDVDLRWTEMRSSRRMRVRRKVVKYTTILIRSTEQPAPIQFYAFASGSLSPKMINGLDTYSMQPTKDGTMFGILHVMPGKMVKIIP